jgi:hypothetical protein
MPPGTFYIHAKRLSNMGQTSKNLATIENLIRRLSSCTSEREALIASLDCIIADSPWICGGFWKIDQSTQTMLFELASGEYPERFKEIAKSSKLERGVGLCGKAWSSAELVHELRMAEVETSPRALVASDVGIVTGVAFPVLVDGSIYGAFEFFSATEIELSAEDITTFNIFDKLVDESLSRVVLQEREKRERERLEESWRFCRLFSKKWPMGI